MRKRRRLRADPITRENDHESRKAVPLAVAALFLAAGTIPALAHAEGKTKTHSVHRSKGADGAVDATHVGPEGRHDDASTAARAPTASPTRR